MDDGLKRATETVPFAGDQAAGGGAALPDLDAWPLGAAYLDVGSQRFLKVNAALSALVGHGRDELLGMTDDEITHCDDRDASGEAWRAFARGQSSTMRLDKRYKRRDGEVVWAHIQAQLRQSQKMEALGALSGGIAHDFNNILTAVVGNVGLATSELPADHPTQTYLADAAAAADRATDLVRRILAFSRPSAAERRALDVASLVEEASRLLRAALPSSIEIATNVAQDLPSVMADPTELHQVLMNLGTNARDAMPRGGVITFFVEAARFRSSGPGPCSRPGLYLRLSVRDTGIGMDPATLERIFEPFFTTKSPGRGTGLGLSVVHGIVRGYEGAIQVSSKSGGGTVFDIFLPAAATPPERLAEATPAARPLPALGRGEHILCVDDQPDLVLLARRLFERAGYRVTGATNAQEALALFEADPGLFDIVITDLGMPDMDGLELARALLEKRAGLPIILTSGHITPEDETRARALGVSEIVPKPAGVEQLRFALRRALSKR